jgi:O-antigen/teichoic acid export membrane protein
MTARPMQKALAWSVPLTVEAMALLRSVVLARAIGPDELGRAMLLALVLRLVEMLSDLGVERQLVRAPGGATPALQARLHAALALRGLVIAALLLTIAPLSSLGFPDGPNAATYAALAVIPAIRGFVHLDYRRAERGYDYRPTAKVELGAAVAMFCALGTGIALGITDHRVLVVAVVGQAAAQVALSHLLATRPWALDFDRSGLHQVWLFGAPLALNAGLMFLTLQADRLIVALAWSWSDVAVYGIVAQLAMLPALVAGRAATSLLLPRFTRARDAGKIASEARVVLLRFGMLGAVFAALFASLGSPVIALVYGAQLDPGFALAAVLGAAAGLRMARTPLSVLALALGQTAVPARANLWRTAALVPALILAAAGAPLFTFAATAVLGEAAAYLRGWRLLLSTPSKLRVSAT